MIANEYTEYQTWGNSYRIETVCAPWELSTNEEKVTLMDPIRFDPLTPLVRKVDQFEEIEESKWAEADYLKPAKSTFHNVTSFLASIGNELLLHLRPSELDVTNYGTFTLDFYFAKNLLSIEIGKDKIGYYSKSQSLPHPVLPGVDFNGEYIPAEISSAFEKFRQ